MRNFISELVKDFADNLFGFNTKQVTAAPAEKRPENLAQWKEMKKEKEQARYKENYQAIEHGAIRARAIQVRKSLKF